MTLDFSAIRRALAGMHDGGVFINHGAHVYLSRHGKTEIDFAIGEARAGLGMGDKPIFRQSCAMKPVLAFVAAGLFQRGGINPDDQAGQFLNGSLAGEMTGITVRHLLNHTSGRDDPFLQPGIEPVQRYAPGSFFQYSPMSDWQILGAVLENVLAAPIGSILETACAQLGMDEAWFGTPPPTVADWPSRLAPFYFADPAGNFDLTVVEDSEMFLTTCYPGVGGFATVYDLAHMYESALSTTGGSALEPSFAAMVSHEVLVTSCHEELLGPGRGLSYGLGVCVDMRRWGISGYLGPRSFGHAANDGATTALCDPDLGVVLVLTFNDALPKLSSMQRRLRIADLLLQPIVDPR